jgi:hypothetical protein
MTSERVISEPLPVLENRHEWQIDRRYRIQNFVYLLYKFLDDHSEFHSDGDDEWHQMLRMADIAFSLWRSAFLTDVASNRKFIYEHTKKFLQKVVETNAITFADDYLLSEMTVSYYNNNARYRIERMYEWNSALLKMPAVQAVASLRKENNLATHNQMQLWDKYFLALVECYIVFKSHWDEHVRPARRPGQNLTITNGAGSNDPQPA